MGEVWERDGREKGKGMGMLASSLLHPIDPLQGFFKRSITKAEKYKCFFGGQCILTPDNRNRCKACRYQKCLQMGMSIEGERERER